MSFIDEINMNISKYVENTISTHFYIKSPSRNIVSEDTLFDYDKQYKLLVSKYQPEYSSDTPPFRGKLTDLKPIQKIKEALETINVKLYFSNSNTLDYWNLWTCGNFRKALFYTNTNLIVRVTNILKTNVPTSIDIFTEDGRIDFCYAQLDYDGNNWGKGMMNVAERPVAHEELMKCKHIIYKYIHPQIYLDYYIISSTEQELNELIFASSLVNKNIQTQMQTNIDVCECEKKLKNEITILKK